MALMEILPKGERYAYLRQRLHLPMALMGVAWVVAIALELTLDSGHPAKRPLLYMDWAIWVIFLSEYLLFLFLSKDKGRYFRENLLDFVIILLPVTRVLRLGRALVLLRGGAIFAGTLKEAWVGLRKRKFHYLLVLNAAAIAAGSVLVDIIESPVNPFFTSYGNCLWWTFVTMATGGYGDTYPRTVPGKLIAVILMLLGISLFSYFAASLASWFVEKDLALEEKQLDRLEKKVDELLKKVESR